MLNGISGIIVMKRKTSSIIFTLRNHTFLKAISYKIFSKKDKIIDTPEAQNKEAKHLFNYKYDCTNPKTFNEYLGWIKFNYSNDLWRKCADKLGVKEFLKSINLEKYVPKTLGIYKNSKEIKLQDLPERFVLKTNHDSGSVFVCNKQTTNFKEVFAKLDHSIENNYSTNGEWVYSEIKPCIFAEELIEPSDKEKELIDYKFFIFNGKFGFGFTAQNREVDCHFSVFEKDFALQDVDYIYVRPKSKNKPQKPTYYDEMVKIAETIGKLFWFVRVDFYNTSRGPLIGELTFFSQSGMGPFTKKEYDYKYGRLFNETPFYELIHKK